MAISVTSRDSGSSTTNATTYTTNTVTASAGELLVVIVCMGGIGVDTTSTVSGLSGTWTNRGHFYDTTGITATTYDVITCSDWSGSGTLTLGNTDSATACLWSIVGVTGADNTNPVVASSFQSVQNNATTSLSITLNAAADSNNRPFSAWAKNNNAAGTMTPQTNWTEIHEVAIGAPNTTFETQWRSDAFDTAAGVTFSDGTFAGSGIAFEMAVAPANTPYATNNQVAPGLTPFDYPVPWMGVTIVSNDVSVNAECPSVSFVGHDPTASVAPNSQNSSVSLAANDANKNVAVNAQNAIVTFTANNSPSSVSVNAGVATASFTANNSTPTVAPSGSDTVVAFAANDLGHEIVQGFFDYNPYAPGLGYPWSLPAPWSGTEATQAAPVSANAECANVTFVSNDATKSESVNSGNSTVAFVANNDAPSVLVNAGNAVASFVAQDVTKSESVNAQNASVSLTVNNNTPSVSVNAQVASVTLTANQPSSGRTPITSALTFVAGDVDESVSVNAGSASVTAVANNGTPSTAVNTDAPVTNFAAQDAQTIAVSDWIYNPLQPGLNPFDEPTPWMGVESSPSGSASAGSADITVVANSATNSISVSAGVASVAFAANNASAKTAPSAVNATVSLTANNSTSSVSPNSTSAAISYTANNPGKSVSVNAGVATVSVSAPSPAAALKAAAGPASVGIVAPNAAASMVAYAGVASIALSIDAPTTKVGPSSGLSSVLWTSLDGTIPVQFLGPPDLIIKKLSTSTAVNDKSNSVTCSAKTDVLTVTDQSNGLIIKKVDNTVTVN